jgi:hypothetical protein
MRIDYLYGSNFELPTVFENFSANNWFATQESHDWAGAAGSSLRALEFDVIFDGDVIPTGFTFATYLRGQHQEFFSAELEGGQNGNHWVTRNCEGDPPPPLNSVPEPTSLLVLGIALVSRVVHRKYSKSPIS